MGTKRYDAHSGGEREIQRTMLELLNQVWNVGRNEGREMGGGKWGAGNEGPLVGACLGWQARACAGRRVAAPRSWRCAGSGLTGLRPALALAPPCLSAAGRLRCDDRRQGERALSRWGGGHCGRLTPGETDVLFQPHCPAPSCLNPG